MSDNRNIIYHFRVRGTGAERVHIAGIANGFRSLGHKFTMVSPVDTDFSAQDQPHRRSFFSGALAFLADHAPQILFEIMEIAYNISGVKKLKRKVRNNNIDFIYERHAFYNLVGTIISKKFNIPLIVEVNELSGFERVRGQVLVKLAHKFDERIFKQATLIVVVSNLLKEKIADMLGSDEKIIVVPNGVSKSWINSTFSNEELNYLAKQLDIINNKVIGFVGGLSHWHNFDFMIDVISDLLNIYPDLILLIVGDGQLKDYIISLAQKRGIQNSVKTTGKIPHREIQKYIQLFDIALIPHSNQFRSPIKLFEYMGTGKAVVAPSTDPIRSVISNGIDGLLFESKNKKDIIKKLTLLLSDASLRRKFGKQAQICITEKYLWEIHATQILKKFDELNLNQE